MNQTNIQYIPLHQGVTKNHKREIIGRIWKALIKWTLWLLQNCYKIVLSRKFEPSVCKMYRQEEKNYNPSNEWIISTSSAKIRLIFTNLKKFGTKKASGILTVLHISWRAIYDKVALASLTAIIIAQSWYIIRNTENMLCNMAYIPKKEH